MIARHAAHLYVPADQPEKLKKANGLPVASVVVDLEDAVVSDRKDMAVESLANSVAALSDVSVWVRINQGARGLADLEHVLTLPGVDGIWIPKAEPGQFFSRVIEAVSNRPGIAVGVLIESARGFVHRNELLAPTVVTRVQLGEYDFRADTGFGPLTTESFDHLTPLRTDIVMSAVAHGVDDIVGIVSADFSDLHSFEQTTQLLFDTGHTTRACIHPAQVNVVNTLATPSEKEIAWARKTLELFAHNEKAGIGAYSDADGEMADKATVRRAERILARAGGSPA